MTHYTETVSDDDLHAYVDGELSAQRRLQVEAWLAAHPQAAARVRDYRMIGECLHDRFDPVLTEPAIMPAIVERRYSPLWARAAVLAAVALFSGTLGWYLKDLGDDAGPLVDLVQPAVFAHQVYTTDSRYPVEIPAGDQASLNSWVSQRMHADLHAPDLETLGLTLIGGRLLPSTNRMAAQFMYEDGQGGRMTVYVRRIVDDKGFSNFRYREQDGLNMFYWTDREMGYAVVGEQPASRLIGVANAVHDAMQEHENRLSVTVSRFKKYL